MEPRFILVERNTVLCGAPDEPGIRDAALLTAKSHGAAVSLYAFVDTCRPSEPVWDSAAASAPVAERFAVGERVEVQEGSVSSKKWLPALIVKVDNSNVPYLVKIDGRTETEWKHIDRTRRPVAAARPFVFGERVRVGSTLNGNRYPENTEAFFMGIDPDGQYRVAIESASCRYEFFKSDQVFPI